MTVETLPRQPQRIEVVVSGEVDGSAVAAFARAIAKVRSSQPRSVTLDLGDVSGIDEEGLRELLRLKQACTAVVPGVAVEVKPGEVVAREADRLQLRSALLDSTGS